MKKGLIMSEIVDRVIAESTIVEPTERFNIIEEDLDDNIIINCAVAGGVDYIISNDKHLLDLKEFRGIKIVTPAEFLEILHLHKSFD
jgi:uncharacterized protein